MPRVSICIPAYKPDFFEQALKSAIGQSYGDTEIIVSDDCPTDAIANICERYQKHLSYSRNPKPSEFSNVIRLANLANGEYIKFLFDDDILNPFCVQFLFETLEESRHLGTRLAFSPRYLIDGKNRITSLVNHFSIADETKVIDGGAFIRVTAVNHMNLIGEFSSVMFRKEDCFDENGTFRLFRVDEDGIFRGILDLSAWIDLAKRGPIIGHPHPLSYFRQHANSTSNHEINPLFINGILYYEEVMKMAFEKGYMSREDLPVSMRRLLNHYGYWQNAYPQLRARIVELQAMLAKL
ncbi:glycosyltransferase family 2 protein [Rhizobium leguminosarum]|uniref:glycosyltransferase family 2 protein n=1 Tax=Rhizobium leguminosarum TaxID=384 RepID=UPI001C98572A|nr:glycosyltransferase family 2 protein [Rhizobium leguminosarum]MBY5411562.1 glycosyltransferase family 2 protein [Rhizobium leguminosarum]